jgi:trehalose 6-phosphate synthase
MLGADLVGFQTPDDCVRFCRAAARLTGATPSDGGLGFEGRFVRIGTFPVGIDVDDVLAVAAKSPTPPRVVAARARGLPVVVGLERGDFTKGIPERVRAIADAFRAGEAFAYIGIAAPTREGVTAYDALDVEIERAAHEARAQALKAGGSFAHVRANVGWNDVVALQRDADVVFTSSLSDGQNLVPLQAAIAQSVRPEDERAVIITGRDAGAASTFAGFEADGLVAVDPLDRAEMQAVLRAALHGRPARVSDRFITAIRERDALSWATSFLDALEATC